MKSTHRVITCRNLLQPPYSLLVVERLAVFENLSVFNFIVNRQAELLASEAIKGIEEQAVGWITTEMEGRIVCTEEKLRGVLMEKAREAQEEKEGTRVQEQSNTQMLPLERRMLHDLQKLCTLGEEHDRICIVLHSIIGVPRRETQGE